jgi:hypothetical protein
MHINLRVYQFRHGAEAPTGFEPAISFEYRSLMYSDRQSESYLSKKTRSTKFWLEVCCSTKLSYAPEYSLSGSDGTRTRNLPVNDGLQSAVDRIGNKDIDVAMLVHTNRKN